MHLYSIYINNKSKDFSPLIIKQGFSFWALIFNFLWAVYHKMWFVAGVVVLTNFIIFSFNPSSSWMMVEKIIQLFVFGFFASEIREFYAEKQGLALDDVILASSEEEAEVKYVMRVGVFK